MPTAGIQSHTLRYVAINTVKYTHTTNWSFTIKGETIDITSFDSMGWRDLASGTKMS
jgi:predicted secreted protein